MSGFLFLWPVKGQSAPDSPVVLLTCSIGTDKTSYKAGQVPKIQVRLGNRQQNSVVVAKILDGSESQMRYPFAYFTIKNARGQIVKPNMLRCGNTNPLVASDFVAVPANGHFVLCDSRFSASELVFVFGKIQGKTHLKPGLYHVGFTYSTASYDLEKWLGDGKLGQNPTQDDELKTLLQRVPKVTLHSNEISIRVVR